MEKLDKQAFDKMIGLGNGPRTMAYTWRDVALYALGVGAHKEDLIYLYEKADMKVLPTFALTPYINTVNLEPKRHLPRHPATIVKDIMVDALGDESLGPLHMSMELTMHRPIDPIQGTLLCEDKVDKIYDRGEGKGIVVQTRMDIYDIAGRPVCTAKGMHLISACGGFGGEKLPSTKLTYPDREPDYVVDDHMSETQHLLYRLTGDVNPAHADPEVARKSGFKEAFMQGLCSGGYACRMAIEAICPGQPERLTYMNIQMRTICYPGTDVRFLGWNMGNGLVYYKLLNDAGKPVLDNGILMFNIE